MNPKKHIKEFWRETKGYITESNGTRGFEKVCIFPQMRQMKLSSSQPDNEAQSRRTTEKWAFLIDHTYWSPLTRPQTIRYRCVCRRKVNHCIIRPSGHILLNSVLYSTLGWFETSSITQHLHFTFTLSVRFSLVLLFKFVVWINETIDYSENKLSSDCPDWTDKPANNNGAYFTVFNRVFWHLPMRLKLSDKVLLNFFILPIFSAGWAAGIKSHMSDLKLRWSGVCNQRRVNNGCVEKHCPSVLDTHFQSLLTTYLKNEL